jgi:hypothetical protein
MSLDGIVCGQVEVSATGHSFVHRSPTECGVSESEREALIMRILCPIRGCSAMGGDFEICKIRRISAPVQNGPGSRPASCTMGTGSFPGVKSGRGVTLTPQPF